MQCLAVIGNLVCTFQVQQINSGDEFTSILTPIYEATIVHFIAPS